MQNHYFNTTGVSETDAKAYESKAKKQEEAILYYLQKFNKTVFTTDRLHRAIFQSRVPYTSVGRAVTKLKDQGYIIDTKDRVKGPRGRSVIIWRLVSLAPTVLPPRKTIKQKLKAIDQDLLNAIATRYGREVVEPSVVGCYKDGFKACLDLLGVKL